MASGGVARVISSNGLVPSSVEAYLTSDAAARSITTSRLIAKNHAGFLRETDVMTDEEFLTDSYSTEWATPNGMHHAGVTAIMVPTGDMAVVQFTRKKELPPLALEELELLDSFRPHIARAGFLAARWRLQRLRGATEALQLLGLPAAVLDYRGTVMAANALMQDTDAGIRWLAKDRIAVDDSAAQALLGNALGELAKLEPTGVRSIPLTATAGGNACILHIIPIVDDARDLFSGAYGMLVLTPLTAGPIPVSTIQALFDLTPSESRIARRIAEGATVEQIALEHSVSIDTVRSHVKAVFNKTGVNRQAQLASLIAGVPWTPLGSSLQVCVSTECRAPIAQHIRAPRATG